MKCFSIFLFLLFTIASFGQDFSFNHGGYERKYLVHLPVNYQSDVECPLVLAFHGGLGKLVLKSNKNTVDIKSLSNGVYFVRFENNSTIKRFVKK